MGRGLKNLDMKNPYDNFLFIKENKKDSLNLHRIGMGKIPKTLQHFFIIVSNDAILGKGLPSYSKIFDSEPDSQSVWGQWSGIDFS